MKANYTIACDHPETGKNGSWIFSGNDHHKAGTSQSPFFGYVGDLFQWMKSNHWEHTPSTTMGCHTTKRKEVTA